MTVIAVNRRYAAACPDMNEGGDRDGRRFTSSRERDVVVLQRERADALGGRREDCVEHRGCGDAAPLPKLQTRRGRRQNRAPSHRRPSASQTIGSVLEFAGWHDFERNNDQRMRYYNMKTILIAVALLCSGEVRAMAESTVTFEADAVGPAPKRWTATKTGKR